MAWTCASSRPLNAPAAAATMLGGEAGTGTRADVSVRAGAESTGAGSILAAGAAGCGAAPSAVGTGAGGAQAGRGKVGCCAAAPADGSALAPVARVAQVVPLV